jgi:hypothetical protein
MKTLLLVLSFLLPLSAVAGDWTVVSVKAARFEAKDDQTRASKDFWLTIKLRNDSQTTFYIPGMKPGWYMIEAFVRDPKTSTWERQNTGVDQNLEMLPVKPGETIESRRRESFANVGASMMLTFNRARSQGDHTGSIILLDPFEIPSP